MRLEQALKSDRFKNERHKATLNILYTGYWYKSHVSALLKEYDLTAEQFNVLRILRGKHPEALCVKEIGSRMLEKSSNVPRIIDRLVPKKLVKRSTSREDKRETLISVTEKGLQLLEVASKAVDKLDISITGLTEEEAGRLNELLEKMRLVD